MSEFTYDQLPVLGVRWVRFATEAAAVRFAKWAERVTLNWDHPCEATVAEDPEAAPGERFEVKVRNW